MKMRNLVREKIAQNGYALGAFVASSSAMNCEILGLNRLDFVIIDCEHAETNTETIVHMCRASELCGMAPLVRVYDPDDGPMMSRINFTKYAPRGKRGANGGRGPRWGLYDDYIHAANENCLTIAQCESIEGLENVEKIAAMPGLDAIFIGTGDLSLEMGIAFKADSSASHTVDDPQIVAAIDRVLAACRKNNVIPGIVTASAEDAARRIRQGFQLVTCMNDLGFFRSHSAQHIASVRELAAR